jgi:hypothetical protein
LSCPYPRRKFCSESKEELPVGGKRPRFLWAVDRGHLNSIEVFVNSNADGIAPVSDFYFTLDYILKLMGFEVGSVCI